MEIELQEISDFVGMTHPFEDLPQTVIEQLIKKMTIRYLRRGTILQVEPVTPSNEDRLYLLRKGAVTLYSEQQQLLGKLGEGDICTGFCQLQEKIKFTIHIDEDTLVYTIACRTLTAILQEYPKPLSYLQQTSTQRLHHSRAVMEEKSNPALTLMQTSLAEIMHPEVITADINISIHDAAVIMNDNNVSSLIILLHEKAVGILTDKDITKRCVAKNIPLTRTVEQIMTSGLTSISSNTSAFDAMMIMTRKQIRHLPVIDDQ